MQVGLLLGWTEMLFFPRVGCSNINSVCRGSRLINPVACPAGKSPSFKVSPLLVFMKIPTGFWSGPKLAKATWADPFDDVPRSRRKTKKIHILFSIVSKKIRNIVDAV